ncbi:XRE family transcriptional regulator [Terasakiispira papahanaumokuakeensis]|uniref:XRE family transcriptional regulator n=1 Tax=Terasakiispira papahanaumokuakeensis TaxID=197479 RepID=A0A1E2V7E3_9GAMM|nr:helix-turn-helix transcriptional regulator [Terasakiispira papahanaumokuakeensis]ODC02575.1 XRE family transcriptional regulator [Terasakiispira papahanaumokuakeensis]
MSKLQHLKERAFQNPEVRHEYDALAEEFEFIDTLLKMRTAAGLTQDELARRMGTQKSNISRLEKGGTNPSWGTLKRYAHACGFELSIDFHGA